jgi:hypothetical protein
MIGGEGAVRNGGTDLQHSMGFGAQIGIVSAAL